MNPASRRCRKDQHDWYDDNHIFTEVKRCKDCLVPNDPVLDEIRKLEERAWFELDHLPTRARIRALKQRVNEERKIRGLDPLPEPEAA